MRRPAQSVERAVFTDSTLILPMESLKTKKEQHIYQVPANHRGKKPSYMHQINKQLASLVSKQVTHSALKKLEFV